MRKLLLLFAAYVFSFNFSNAQTKENDLEQKINNLISQMTLEEKASLCSGRDDWSTRPIDRLSIPWIWVSDGPHGLRRAPATDKAGYGDQHPATCFPTASALAATWDTDLIYKVGQALATECHALNVNVILGPGVNIKRHPLGGRNFEYFSEDPTLSGEIGAAYINGVQSQGVGVSLKHYALNNEEHDRMLMSSEADERTIRELYLVPFEIAVKKAQPWTVMACYNRINGVYGTQNKFLLTDVLRNEWGFKGIVISDWVSVVDRVEGIRAGMNIEMPGSNGVNDSLIVLAVKNKQLDEKVLDEIVRQILRVVFKAKSLEKKGVTLDIEGEHKFARKVASEAITLLKNEADVLPITPKYKTIAIIGEFAKAPRYQGNGSSEVKPTKLDNAYDEIVAIAGTNYKVIYANGYNLKDDNDLSRIDSAKNIAKQADLALVFAGLPTSYESEGFDRWHISMPGSHDKLISEVASVQKNTVVVLTNGSAIAMPWNKEVKGILEAWLVGQAGGGAVADVLFGKVNPSGKIAETFPMRLEDTPAYLNFPGEDRKVFYGERLYVGYKYYDAKKIEPLYPFGFGLSYTKFEYADLKVSAKEFTDNDILKVSFTIKNVGQVAGKEVVQLYVGDKKAYLQRPLKELKKFAKIELQPGESKVVTLELNNRDFSFYDVRRKTWVAESGEFDILVGASSRDIKLQELVKLNSTQKVTRDFDLYTYFNEFYENPLTRSLTLEYFKPWIMTYAKPNQTVDQVYIDNWFLRFMPIVKFPYISRGLVTREKIDEFLMKAQELDKK